MVPCECGCQRVFGVAPLQDHDSVPCSDPFDGSLSSVTEFAQRLVFARVSRIYGTKSHIERWLPLECITQRSARKCDMHCQ